MKYTLHSILRISIFICLLLNTGLSYAQIDFEIHWERAWGTSGGPEPAGLDSAFLPIIPERFGSMTLGDLDGDGDKDFVSGSNRGKVFYFENTGTPSSPFWELSSHATLDTIKIGKVQNTNETRPDLVDIDNDGDLDLFIGSRWNYAGFHKLDDIYFYRNIGSDTNSIFQLDTISGLQFQQVGEFAGLAFVDLDNDNDLDLVSGGSDSCSFFLNVGTITNPSFERKHGAENPFDGVDGSGSSNSNWIETSFLVPTLDFEDFDNDGDYDMFYMNESGFIRYIPNNGTVDLMDFSPYISYPTPSLDTVDFGAFGACDIEDVNGDGIKDLLASHWNPTRFYWYKGISEGSTAQIHIDSTIGCNGSSDGVLSVEVIGESSYTYLWSTGDTSQQISGLPSGDYTVYYTDTFSVVDSVSITLSEPDVLEASAVVDSNVSCNGLATGGATVSAIGGTPPYSYLWSNTATTSFITGVSAGFYGVRITDSKGCSDSTSIVITEPSALQVTTVVDSNVLCHGDANGGATVGVTGGLPPYIYEWSNGATTTSITGVVAGNYGVKVVDANGCSDSTSLTITETPLLMANAVIDSNITCNGVSYGGATASATGGHPPYTYSWSHGAITSSITGLTSDVYTVTILDVNGCSDTASVSITEPLSISASAVVDSNVSCNGLATGGATVSAIGGTPPYSYLWSNTATTSFITGVSAGFYGVRITDSKGCSDSTSIVITEPSALQVTAVLDSNVMCHGDANGGATAGVTGGLPPYIYEWSNGATTTSITGVESGIYTLTVTDMNGCMAIDSVTITEPALLESIDTVIALGEYTWINGVTYDASIYGPTHTLTNMHGCDSIVTLDFSLVNYCSLKSTRNRFEWIKQVEIGDNFNHITNKDGSGYGDYTDDIITVDTGDVVSLTLTPGYKRRVYEEYWRIWADWNYDGDFEDAGEKVFEQKGKQVRTGTFTVPIQVSSHDLRLRVSMRWKKYSSSCGSYRNGEVEDYTIRVNGAQQGNNGYQSVKLYNDTPAIPDGSLYEFSTIYPTPVVQGEAVYGYIRVEELGLKDIRIVNALGQVVKTVLLDCIEEETRFEISTKDLSKGIYFLNIDGGVETSKIVVQ